MKNLIPLVGLLACAAQAQVKVVGFTQDHVLLYQASATKGAIVKLDEGRTPALVDLASSQWKTAMKAVAPLKPGPSPGDKVPIALSVKLSSGKGSWTNERYSWSVAPKKRPTADEPQGHALIVVQDITGAGSALALDVSLRALSGTLTPFWEDNGSFFAVLVEPAAGAAEVVVGRADISATTVEVLATAEMDEAGRSVAEQLWKDGRSVVRIGRALKPREQTVVFTTPANSEQAQAVANAISGGAPVQALTWKSDCQVVVGVGESSQ